MATNQVIPPATAARPLFQVGLSTTPTPTLPDYRAGCPMVVYFGPRDACRAVFTAFYEALPKFLLATAPSYNAPAGVQVGNQSYYICVECHISNTSPGAVRRSQRFYQAMQALYDSLQQPAPPAEPAARPVSAAAQRLEGLAAAGCYRPAAKPPPPAAGTGWLFK
jgi:hypothetical protein